MGSKWSLYVEKIAKVSMMGGNFTTHVTGAVYTTFACIVLFVLHFLKILVILQRERCILNVHTPSPLLREKIISLDVEKKFEVADFPLNLQICCYLLEILLYRFAALAIHHIQNGKETGCLQIDTLDLPKKPVEPQ